MVLSFASPVFAVDDLTNLLQVDAENFSRPTIIDNEYMPLMPGLLKVYEGWTINDEGEEIPHMVISIATDLVKDINGIETVVMWDRDIADGKLEEFELYFRAQDDEGNVWHFGEVKEVYDEDLKIVGAKVWMEGRLGALAGIIMEANPATDTPSVSQGYAPGVYRWDDRGQVRNVGETVTVAAGTFEDVIVIEEWSAPELEMEAAQLKYYAPSIGYVKVGFEGDDPVKEVLELTEVRTLNEQEMDEARAEALLVEERSYFYGETTRPPYRRQN